MKLIFHVDESKLPEQFQGLGGLENILYFLHGNLYSNPLNKALVSNAQAHYLKAFYDQNNLNGQAVIDAIEADMSANTAFGKLLLDSLEIQLTPMKGRIP